MKGFEQFVMIVTGIIGTLPKSTISLPVNPFPCKITGYPPDADLGINEVNTISAGCYWSINKRYPELKHQFHSAKKNAVQSSVLESWVSLDENTHSSRVNGE